MPDLFGITIPDPPEGWTCLEILILGKAINNDGHVVMFIRQSDDLPESDALGMIAAAYRVVSDEVAESFFDG